MVNDESNLIRVADPGSGAFSTPGSGMGKTSRSGSGMNIPVHISESLETVFGLKILTFVDANPDPGSESFLTLDQGWKISDSGIRDKHPDPQH
jgi:hypothetical protein